MAFDDFVKEAYMARVHLSAAGFYKTPKIHWDRSARHRAAHSTTYAYGAACSEVAIDTLTGEYRVERTDILHDVGPIAEPGPRQRARSKVRSFRAWVG